MVHYGEHAQWGSGLTMSIYKGMNLPLGLLKLLIGNFVFADFRFLTMNALLLQKYFISADMFSYQFCVSHLP